MTLLDRKLLDRIDVIAAQVKMLATLQKKPDVLAELDVWERRRQTLIKRLESEAANRVIHFPFKKNQVP